MMTPVQAKLLGMLKWFHDYCAQNNITYYAVGGTMLGAARHSGFIPWDDDIDIAIPRKEYEKLISLFTHPIDGYYLESPYSGNADYLYSYAKLYDTHTTFVEKTKTLCKRGLYIDVFPLDGVGNTLAEAQKNFSRFDRKNMFLMTRTCVIRKDRSWYKNAGIVLANIIPDFLVDNKKLSISVDRLASEINTEQSVFVANLMGAYRSKEITRKECFGTPTLYAFEDTQIYGPEKFDEYLSIIYKNWRELPPPEKRKTAHDYYELDLDKPYME